MRLLRCLRHEGRRAVVRVGRSIHHAGVHGRELCDLPGVLHGYDIGRLGTHGRRSICSGLEDSLQLFVCDLFGTVAAAAAPRLDQVQEVFFHSGYVFSIVWQKYGKPTAKPGGKTKFFPEGLAEAHPVLSKNSEILFPVLQTNTATKL